MRDTQQVRKAIRFFSVVLDMPTLRRIYTNKYGKSRSVKFTVYSKDAELFVLRLGTYLDSVNPNHFKITSRERKVFRWRNSLPPQTAIIVNMPLTY